MKVKTEDYLTVLKNICVLFPFSTEIFNMFITMHEITEYLEKRVSGTLKERIYKMNVRWKCPEEIAKMLILLTGLNTLH